MKAFGIKDVWELKLMQMIGLDGKLIYLKANRRFAGKRWKIVKVHQRWSYGSRFKGLQPLEGPEKGKMSEL